MHKLEGEGGGGQVGGVTTTFDAAVAAAGWGTVLSPAAAHRDWLTHMFK